MSRKIHSCVVLLCLSLVSAESVLQMSSVFRHGARNSLNLEYLSAADAKFNVLRGELTSVGMRQHYNLGAQMRTRYVDDLGLLSAVFDPREIRIRTTDVNRTVVSALSQLQGLYPSNGPKLLTVNEDHLLPPYKGVKDVLAGQDNALPNSLQLVPSHTLPEEDDTLLLPYSQWTCPIQKDYIQAQKNTDIYQKMVQNSSAAFDWMEKQFNVKFPKENRDLGELGWAWGNKNVLEYQGRPWYSPPDEVYKQMQFVFNWQLLFSMYGTMDQLKLENSNFLTEVAAHMQDTIDGKSVPKVNLYSAHDTTVMFVIRALNLTSPECIYAKYTGDMATYNKYKYCYEYPTFASNVQFELVEKDKAHFVRMLYQGEVVKVCKNQSVELCPFQDFLALRDKFHLHNMHDICKETPVPSTPKTYKGAFIGFAIAFVVMTVLFALALFQIYRMKNAAQPQEENYQAVP